jgi:hypothetical protein
VPLAGFGLGMRAVYIIAQIRLLYDEQWMTVDHACRSAACPFLSSLAISMSPQSVVEKYWSCGLFFLVLMEMCSCHRSGCSTQMGLVWVHERDCLWAQLVVASTRPWSAGIGGWPLVSVCVGSLWSERLGWRQTMACFGCGALTAADGCHPTKWQQHVSACRRVECAAVA